MNRSSSNSNSSSRLQSTFDLFIIGEQLRVQMTKARVIKDQRHHFRKHRKCFVAKDAVDWLLRMRHVETRQSGVSAMTVLQEFNMIHHVTEQEEFKDKSAFFRFRKDDDSYLTDRELSAFYKGLEIYDKLKVSGKHVMREFYHKGKLHEQAFYGSDLLDFLQQSEKKADRDVLMARLSGLHDRGIIKNMTGGKIFVDDKLIYEFGVDFHKPCMLAQVLDIMEAIDIDWCSESSNKTPDEEDEDTGVNTDESDDDDSPRLESSMSYPRLKSRSETVTSNLSASTLVSTVTHNNLVEPENEIMMKLCCDRVGLGMVLKGSGPCYVHHVTPLGPASKAKVKVGQVVSSVNGKPVGHMDHQEVGRLVAQCDSPGAVLFLGVTNSHRKHHRS